MEKESGLRRRGMRDFTPFRSIDVPRRWQRYIYAMGLIYTEISPHYKDMIDEVCQAVGGEYSDALKQHITRGDSVRRVACDKYVSETALRYRVRRFYSEMYRRIISEK